MMPATLKTTMRGPADSTASRKVPGPVSARLVTTKTFPPRPPKENFAPPSAPGNAGTLACGKDDDAKQFSELAQKIRAAFNEKFYETTNHFYATDSQCANAIPLVFDICEASNRAAVVDAIVRDVRARGNALTAGDVGYRYLLRALADGGRSDVIFAINNQTNKAGYGMQ